ncbi:hypothetical protein ABFS82_12G021600 [Erythranthe guttata]|uniref:DUF4228 domain-containing protein n=1 Tax=Erythranthe guttata TaxID=4155 RepID=A0A022RMT3_ERYGU|nr:PREDICTED: uncharacterized protein LOC105953457 isoform X1 [Erythranthe guttata]EYU41379.1 hypothetical protein MIMGU_mgv1a017698mg [Erythranthe guttata]|eukprot:XP_012832570.1 PREDICTED: uncharacterized protein LOC105953457 isoform X1 [Erythranthe guttata]
MGNCQAAEAATVVIQHPSGGKVERIYWSVSANEVMNSNPGHYVALVIASPASARRRKENGAAAVKQQLKLLRPDDTLVLGQVYRLISFEDVLKEFAAKKCVKLGKLLKERNQAGRRFSSAKAEHGEEQQSLGSGGDGGGSSGIARHQGGGGQWRPALQSISEIET